MTTIEGNKLIAEFMGWKSRSAHETGAARLKEWQADNGKWWESEELPFNKDWNELMLVVEKIASMGYNVEIINTPKYKTCRIYKSDNSVASCGAIVSEKSFDAIVQFIQWYNENKGL